MGLAAASVLAGLVLLGAGWYYADTLKSGALAVNHDADELDLEVVALEGGVITLKPTSADDDGDWSQNGTFGLEWEDGYGRVGEIVDSSGERVVRRFAAVRGSPEIGAAARLDSFAFSGDPLASRGIPFREVTYTSPLGDFPAWLTEGPGDVWAIFVHGKGADREEALRMLPAVAQLGVPSLIITYRNDEGLAADPSGLYRYGETEWEDLQGAIQYALDQGAKRVVLVGYSMGGAIVIAFLYRAPLADRVAGVILDSPVLDLEAVVDWGARSRFAPWPFKDVGKAIAGGRFDIDWAGLNYLRRADELAAPILLFHGGDDEKVPVRTSDQLAAARPDLTTYVRVAGAGHVRSWNSDPETYEAAVNDFLLRVLR